LRPAAIYCCSVTVGTVHPLIGRRTELGSFTALVDEVRAGRGGLMLLAGEPGTGKSRLATEASDLAVASGCAVAWGACRESANAPELRAATRCS